MTREATAIYLGPVLSLVVLLTFQAIAGEAQPGGVSYRGVVVIEASGQPVANAQIKAFKYRKPWLLPVPPALRLMGEGRSDSEGRFGFGALNYATELRVATDDRTYYAKIKARPKRRDRDFVVRLKPAVSISYYRASDHWKIARRLQRAVVKIIEHHDRFQSGFHTLSEYHEKGTIDSKELTLFREHRFLFSRPCDSPEEIRFVWGRRALNYVSLDEPIEFLKEVGCDAV